MGLKLALHRSIVFWSGILVMGFIAWAWWDSWQRVSGGAAKEVVLANEFGGVVVVKLPPGLLRGPAVYDSKHSYLPGHSRESLRTPLLPRFYRVTHRHDEAYNTAIVAPGSAEAFQRHIDDSISARRSHLWWIYVPHWLLTVGVAVPWAAALLWRARRRRMKFEIREEQPHTVR